MKKNACKMTALLLALMLTGCGEQAPAETTVPIELETAVATETIVTTEASVATEPSIADGMEFAPQENTGIAVDTPYITLHYPEEWQGIVTAEQTEAAGGQMLTFRTTIGEADAVLFSLIFSGAETAEGFPLGVLTQENGDDVHVFAAMNETIPETWSEEEINQFGSMQERVNDLIMQLNEDPRFDSGR